MNTPELIHELLAEIPDERLVAEAHERRQNSARFRSVKSLNGSAGLFGHGRRQLRQTSRRSGSTQPRTCFPYPQFSGPPLRAEHQNVVVAYGFVIVSSAPLKMKV